MAKGEEAEPDEVEDAESEEDDSDDDGEPEKAKDSEVPEPLSAEYHRARRNLNLVSALFFAVEFVGVGLKPDHDGNTSFSAGGFPWSVKSPDAVPVVLLALVLFFGVRLVLEWSQCDERRRQVVPSRADFVISMAIAVASIGAYAYQQTTKKQLFDLLESSIRELLSAALGFVAPLPLMMGVYVLLLSRGKRLGWRHVVFVLLCALTSVAVVTLGSVVHWISGDAFWHGTFVCVGTCALVMFFGRDQSTEGRA